MQEILARLLDRRPLSASEAQRAFHLILTGQANESQVGAMLALIAARGPTLDEVVGGAAEMRAHVARVPIDAQDPIRATLIDTCGTGGAPKTFNISTAAAFVAAGARTADGRRAYVAKHGGRSRTGRGSAEVLQMLGVNIDASSEVQARCLREVGVCFSFAVNHHPAMKFAAGPRKSLGFPTIFNLLGPLCNPAGATRQVMGVYDERYVPLIAEAMGRLGAVRAMIVHGHDGMDEITTAATTRLAHVTNSGVRSEILDASALGIASSTHDDLAVRTLDDSARAIVAVLAGEPGPKRDIVLLNAAAALIVAGLADDFPGAISLAREAIDSGRAREALAGLAPRSNLVA